MLPPSRALPMRLLRRNENQQEATIDLPFKGDATPNTALRDDDKVVVRGADELQRTVLVIGVAVLAFMAYRLARELKDKP